MRGTPLLFIVGTPRGVVQPVPMLVTMPFCALTALAAQRVRVSESARMEFRIGSRRWFVAIGRLNGRRVSRRRFSHFPETSRGESGSARPIYSSSIPGADRTCAA